MVRLLAIGLILTLASCAPDGAEAPRAPTISAQNAGDTRNAKQVFEALSFASSQPTESFGGHSRGCVAGTVQLAETGPTWQAMRLSRNRNWAQPMTVDYIQDLSRFAASLPGWEGLYVGDMSLPRGGPVSGHVSHQTGLDIDVWMLPPSRLNLTRAERESLSSISMRRASGAYTNSNWSEEHMRVLREAARDPRSDRIFVFPGAKVAMCNWEAGDRSWLRKVRPWWGHHYHFHVRLACPRGDGACENQTPPPPGDGCADAEEWVRNILNPPPPDPNAPPPRPRRELTMADLPAQCVAVAASD